MAQGLVFEGILKSLESKVGTCLVLKYTFEGLQKYEKNERLDKQFKFRLENQARKLVLLNVEFAQDWDGAKFINRQFENFFKSY